MHTKTQSCQSHNRPGLWTEQGDNHHHPQTVHQIHCRILQHQLDSKPLRYTLQHTKNTTKNALRTATGCTKTAPIDHLHPETKTLKVRDHMDLIGTQFYDRVTIDMSHPVHRRLHTHTHILILKYWTPLMIVDLLWRRYIGSFIIITSGQS